MGTTPRCDPVENLGSNGSKGFTGSTDSTNSTGSTGSIGCTVCTGYKDSAGSKASTDCIGILTFSYPYQCPSLEGQQQNT